MSEGEKMKVILRTPTAQYAYLEAHGTEDDLPKMIEMHNTYTDGGKIKVSDAGWEEIETFTGEKIRYNDLIHAYTDMEGRKLISGSEYKKRLEKPFDKAMIIPKVAKKYGISDGDVDAVWTSNADVSTLWGDAIHLAMEHYFTHKHNGCDEKEYHIANPPVLRNTVLSFPDLELNIIPEVIVSATKLGMIGRIDALIIDDMDKKICRIGDYKTDYEMDEKKRTSYFNQLSFYAHILQAHGWTVLGLRIWHFDTEWHTYDAEVTPLLPLK